MRDDMAKVIVERPRHRSWDASSIRAGDRADCRRTSPEEWRSRAPMRPREGRKSLSENLRPLFRFLDGCVGRPWTKVHAELSAHVSFENAVQAHTWAHVEQHICLHPMVIDGVLYDPRGGWMWSKLYVDPRTGLVCRNKERRHRWPFPFRHAVRDRLPMVKIDESHRAVQVEGIWYFAEFAAIRFLAPKVYDVILKCDVDYHSPRLAESYGEYIYATHKRQMNSKEIQRIVKPVRPSALPTFVTNRRR